MFKCIAPHRHKLLSVITVIFGTSHRDKIQTVSTIQSDVSVMGLPYKYRGCCGVAMSQMSGLLYHAWNAGHGKGRGGIGNEMWRGGAGRGPLSIVQDRGAQYWAPGLPSDKILHDGS